MFDSLVVVINLDFLRHRTEMVDPTGEDAR